MTKPRRHSTSRAGDGKPPERRRRPAGKIGSRPPRAPAATRRSDTVPSTSTRADLAPDPTAPIPVVNIKRRILQPLVYRQRIERVQNARPGDLVAVYTSENELVGYGLYNPRSEIALRMLWYGEQLPDEEAWNQKLQSAVQLRRNTLQLDQVTNAYRVLHAESDGVSGLVVDKLADVLSAEVFSLGMYQRAEAVLQRLAPLCNARHTLVRCSPQFLSQEGCAPPDLKSPELPNQVVIHEHGTRFRVRFEGGHKTGFFCDQRDNRQRLAAFCAGKTVLDVCCYTGGFAVQAKTLGKAAEVTGVDLDEAPLALARENANLNQARVRFVQADAFAYLREMASNRRQYDVVILDPPKWIRTRAELEEGTRKHFALNRLAMRLVKPGGMLLSCSCAGLLTEAEFVRLLVAAARQSGDELDERTGPANARYAPRTLQFLARSGAAGDHPVISTCLETEYLKAAWMILH